MNYDALAANVAALPNLPQTVHDLAGKIGMDKAVKLVEAFGGLTLDIPKGKANAGQIRREALIEVIGVRATEVLIETYGGDKLYIPSCKDALITLRNRSIVTAYEQGTGVAELAREHRLSERQIWSILKDTDMTAADTQGTLF
jgi:Mor family transcriptional regulator